MVVDCKQLDISDNAPPRGSVECQLFVGSNKLEHTRIGMRRITTAWATTTTDSTLSFQVTRVDAETGSVEKAEHAEFFTRCVLRLAPRPRPMSGDSVSDPTRLTG